MHDAEATPSPDLWARIDHDLTVQENAVYKRRMVLYRQLAAACFVLFVLAGSLFVYHFSKEEQQQALAAVQLPAATPAVNDPAPAVASLAVPAGAETALPESIENEPASMGADYPAKPEKRAGARVKIVSQPDVILAAAPETISQTAFTIDLPADQVSLESIAARHGRSFGTHASPDENSTGSKARTAFASLQPFYQTARQAIAAVPASADTRHILNSPAAQQLLRNPSVAQMAAGAVQELHTILSAEARQHKNQQDALVLALNGDKNAKKGASDSDSRWTVGMAYAPSYFDQNIGIPNQVMSTASMRSFTQGGPSVNAFATQSLNEAREEYEDNTDPGFSYSFDAKVGFKLGRKWKLLSGIGYLQNTARTKSSYIIRQFLNKPQSNEQVALDPSTVLLTVLDNKQPTDSISVSKTDNYNVNYRYRHLTLPVGLQYQGRLAKDWYWYAASGVAANFLLQTTVMASSNEVSDVNFGSGDDSPFRKVQLSGNVSAGVGKRLSNAISVSVGPEFRGYFNTLLAEPDNTLAPQGKPYTIGLNMAVNYELGSGRK